MSDAQVTAILVAYNSEKIIAEALKPLLVDPAVASIMVVDNCSTDDTCDLIKRDFPKAILIENPKNEGFGRGNNVALAKVKTPYALLVNPDAVLETGSIAKLIDTAMRYPDAAILAPQLYDETGAPHHSYKRTVFAREQSKDHYILPEGDCCAGFLSGAVWLFNMALMRKVGFFDPELFLYYEDDDLCLRVCKASYGLVLVPEAKALHLMGGSSGVDNPATMFFKQQHMAWSRLYMEEKYRGKKAASKLAFKLQLAYAFKAAVYVLFFNWPKVNRYRGRLKGIFDFSERAARKA